MVSFKGKGRLVMIIGRLLNYAWRAAKVWDVAVLGDGARVMEKAYAKGLTGHRNVFTKDFYSNFWNTTKTAGKELEAYKATQVAKHGSTWKVFGNNFKNIPSRFSQGWKVGGRYASITGKNAFMCKMKGALRLGGRTLGRVAGPLALCAFEIPNIVRATKDGGIGAGLVETGKAAAKIGGFVAGAAAGQALIPIPVVGALIGGILGDRLVSKLVGKSHTEKKAEEEQKLAEAQQAQQVAFTGGQVPGVEQGGVTNPFQQQQNAAMLQHMLSQGSLSDDFMVKANNGNLNLLA